MWGDRKLLAAALWLTFLVVVPAQHSDGTAPAVYADTCNAGTQATSWAVFTRSATDFTGVLGRAYTRTQRPCTGATGYTKWDYPLVLPANIQKGGGQIVQLGYLKCGAPASDPRCGTSNIPNDGQHHFVYTFNDNEGGLLYLADSWYRSPVVGHTYRYTIYQVSGIWYYCIADVGLGENWTCKSRAATWNNGTLAWWGTETQNSSSQQGGGGLSDAVKEWDLRYRRGSAWYIVTDRPACEWPAARDPNDRCTVESMSYTNDTLVSYTVPH